MDLPAFLLGDNSNYPDDVYVIHTHFPRFIINLKNDEVEWLEEFDKEDVEELKEQAEHFIAQAISFYEREVDYYQK